MLSRRLAWVLGCSVPATVLCVLAASACLPHPEEDFNNYTERTAGFRQQAPAGEAGPSDSAPPVVAVEGLYYGVCLSALAAGRVDRVLRFYTETKFTPDPVGGTGKIALKLTAMKLGPGNTAPPTVSKSQTEGPTYTVPETPTNAKGVFNAVLGTVNIPGSANPISGRDIVIEEVSVPGRFETGKFCTQLRGHVVQPTDIVLEGLQNTCIYFPVKEGDVPPEIKIDRSDFPTGGCNID